MSNDFRLGRSEIIALTFNSAQEVQTMEAGSLSKLKNTQLTQEKFDKLLLALNPDRMVAAEMYEHLRKSIITFFSFRGASDPDDLTDETLNRVASRLHDGAEIFAQNPSSYFYGFARHIWHETVAKKNKLQSLDESFSDQRSLSPNPHEALEKQLEQHDFELRLSHLNNCLKTLLAKDRELLVQYYQDNKTAKIENRQALAERYGISLKTLRNKTTLLRAKVGDCVRQALASENKSQDR